MTCFGAGNSYLAVRCSSHQDHLLHCQQEKLPKAGHRVHLKCCTSHSLVTVGNITLPSLYTAGQRSSSGFESRRANLDQTREKCEEGEAGAVWSSLQIPVSPKGQRKGGYDTRASSSPTFLPEKRVLRKGCSWSVKLAAAVLPVLPYPFI